MRKKTLLFLALAFSFFSGFALNALLANKQPGRDKTIRKVTGIGGIFFKCKDPEAIRSWYQTNLGINTNKYGAVFEWWQGADSSKKGFSQWSPFSENTKYFLPSTREFMINYRVEDLVELVKELKQNKVNVLDSIETYDYGKFVHILDPEGNKIELWEPDDIAYEKLGRQIGAITTK